MLRHLVETTGDDRMGVVVVVSLFADTTIQGNHFCITNNTVMTISMIVAMGRNRAIGKGGDLIWHLSADLRHFKEVTMGKTVVMGRKTYESLPHKRPLPGRRNVILSERMEQAPDGFELVGSVEQVVSAFADCDELMIMGGGSIYEQFLPLANRLYLTKLDKSFDGDTFFPVVNFDEWQLVDLQVIDDDPQVDFSYRFEVWERLAQ